MALEHADADQRSVVERYLGDPDLDRAGVDALRAVIADTGALARVESLIEERTAEAIAALRPSRQGVDGSSGPVAPEAAEVLERLAIAATARRV